MARLQGRRALSHGHGQSARRARQALAGRSVGSASPLSKPVRRLRYDGQRRRMDHLDRPWRTTVDPQGRLLGAGAHALSPVDSRSRPGLPFLPAGLSLLWRRAAGDRFSHFAPRVGRGAAPKAEMAASWLSDLAAPERKDCGCDAETTPAATGQCSATLRASAQSPSSVTQRPAAPGPKLREAAGLV